MTQESLFPENVEQPEDSLPPQPSLKGNRLESFEDKGLRAPPYRRIGLTPQIIEAVVAKVRQGVPASTALKALGISNRTIANWVTEPITGTWANGSQMSEEAVAALNDFREKVGQAEAEFEDSMVAAIAETGFKENSKTGLREWRALAWVANNHPGYNKRYRQERVTFTEGEQTIRHEHRLVREISDKALREFIEE